MDVAATPTWSWWRPWLADALLETPSQERMAEQLRRDAAYVELRLSQTHDLWHVITGFDPTVAGEIGLQAFHLTQFPYPLGAALKAQALLSITLGAPELLPELVQAIRIGLQMGQEAGPLFGERVGRL
jgi:ubiquinone biosynthesis protein Coq4